LLKPAFYQSIIEFRKVGKLFFEENLNLKTFRPLVKNPPIAKVFSEIGLADELGSGIRNSLLDAEAIGSIV